MELRWSISLAAILFSSAFCVAMYLFQQWDRYRELMPVRGSDIEGTDQKFLYWQDFYCQRYGSLGIVLIWIGFAHFAFFYPFSWPEWIACLMLAVTDGVCFTALCLRPAHKPDYGFPEAQKISKAGVIHSIYHGLTVAVIASMVVRGFLLEEWRNIFFVFLGLGIVLYFFSIRKDFRLGHFRSL